MSPFSTILLSFLFAKATLLAIVLGTTYLNDLPIPFYQPPSWPFGYDSSSSCLIPEDLSTLGRIISSLLRWDSVYFVSIATRREYVWEQEWAFGPGWPLLIQGTSTREPSLFPID
jgi:Mannosyltransferase (PIG-V)